MIRYLAIFKSFPRWVIAALIIVLSSVLFFGWWITRHRKNPVHLAATPPPSNQGPSFNPDDLRFDELVLCGNTLVNFHTGQVLVDQWLEGFTDEAPPIVKVLPSEKLVICGNRGNAGAFSFDGKAKPPIAFEDQPIGFAGYSFSDSRVLFIRGGDLWLGRVDWIYSTVKEAKRVTDVGYFREDTFRGEWFWYGDVLFVPVQGRPHRVDLTNGSISQDQADVGAITLGSSPDGKMSAAAFQSGSFLVVNFATGQAKQIATRRSFRDFLWLDTNRLAFVSDQEEISVLDAITGKVQAFEAPATILKLAAASPNGTCVMVGTSDGPMIFSTSGGKFTLVDLPMDDGIWSSENELLCSCSSTETAVRGVWLADSQGTKVHLSNQPIDSTSSASRSRPMVATRDQALWVAGGDLWICGTKEKASSRLTHQGNLDNQLQILTPTGN